MSVRAFMEKHGLKEEDEMTSDERSRDMVQRIEAGFLPFDPKGETHPQNAAHRLRARVDGEGERISWCVPTNEHDRACLRMAQNAIAESRKKRDEMIEKKYEPPRRSRLDQMTEGERAITAAVDAVEKMGADPLLTDAITLLASARHKVADFVDGPEVARKYQMPTTLRDPDDDETLTHRVVSAAVHEPLLRHFRFAHLRSERMRSTSRAFTKLALLIADTMPGSAERTVALRKLVESKDCAVRAVIDLDEAGR